MDDPRKYYERARDLSGKHGTKAAGLALVTVILGILLVFWSATEYEAARFGFQPALGRPTLGEALAAPFGYKPTRRVTLATEVYDPFGFVRWEWTWSWQPWLCSRLPERVCHPLVFPPRARAFKDATFAGGHRILMGGCALAFVLLVVLAIRRRRPRQLKEKDRPLIYGSARWANREEKLKYAVGYYTIWQKLLFLVLLRFGVRRRRQIGFVLGKYKDERTGRAYQLRTDDRPPRGAVVLGISGSGKSACVYIPSLLQYKESAIIYDPSFELVFTTAGAREQVLRNEVHIIAPTLPDDNEFGIVSDCINPLDAVRWGTPHEIGDLQSHTALMLDPSDKAAEGAEAHWIVCGKALGDAVFAYLRYADPQSCSYRGAKVFLANPTFKDNIDAAFDLMMQLPLDPTFKYGWKDQYGQPTTFHPLIQFNATMMKRKPPAEKGSIISTLLRFLDPYDDPLLARLTSHSTILFEDLMNGPRPQSWYFCLPERDVQRLRLWFRTTLGMATRVQMGEGAITYVKNEPVARARWRLGLFIDEARQLGPQELLFMLFSATRKYKVFPVLGFQDYGQVEEVAGKAGVANLPYKIFFAPDSDKTAKWESEQIGITTVVRETETVSGPRFGMQRILGLGLNVSNSIDLRERALAKPDELMRMNPNEAVVKITNEAPMVVERFFYKSDPELLRRSQIQLPGGRRHTLRDRAIAPLIPNPVSPGGRPVSADDQASRAREEAASDGLHLRPEATTSEVETRSPEDQARAAAEVAAGAAGPPADRRSTSRADGEGDRRSVDRPESAPRLNAGHDRRDVSRAASTLSGTQPPAAASPDQEPIYPEPEEEEQEEAVPVVAATSVAGEMRPAEPAAVSIAVLSDEKASQLGEFMTLAGGEPNGEDSSAATMAEAALHEHQHDSGSEFELDNF